MPRPLASLTWLLGKVSSRHAARAVIGDLIEEFRERSDHDRPSRHAALWLNLQILRFIAAAFLSGAPRLIRSAGLIVRDGVRAFRIAPAQSLFIVLVLAAGVTTGTVTFSVVDAVVLKPLPLAEPEQLVGIPTRDENFTERITPELFWRLHDHLTSVEGLAPRMTFTGDRVRVGEFTDEWPVTFTTAEIFDLLRWTPAIGRFWTPDEEARGETDVAVLGYRFWRQQFSGATSVLGETVAIGKRTYRVIGVLPAISDHPELDLGSAPIWVPRPVPRTAPSSPFGILARMRPGVTTTQVADEIARLAEIPGWRPVVTPLLDGYVRPVRQWMLLALGAAALVVLIACVNAANMMLTRATRRAQEMAIRASLGASGRQITATLLVEGILLSAAATVCALLLSVAGVQVAKLAVTTMLRGIFRASTISLNGRVLVAGITIAALTGVLIAIVPAWQTSRAPVSSLLKDGAATVTTGRRRWRGVFLTAEIASVVVLLVVSWLFVASLIRVVSIDVGIDGRNLIAINPRLEFQGTVDEVQERLERVPGVSSVAVAAGSSLPLVGRAFGGAWHTTTLDRADDTRAASSVTVLQYRVTSNYFDVAGLRFLRGGTWSAQTASDALPVVLDERAARQLFGEEDPLGRHVRATEPKGVFRVVGTVPHAYVRGPEEAYHPSAYFPLRPSSTRTFAGLFVRTSRPPEKMLSPINEALKPLAPLTKDPFVFVADEALARLTATRRFNAGLMSAFGLVGVLIGAAGVYAVMTSFVAQQTREIGVRLALGATPARIQRGVLTLAWRHLAAGLTLGLPIAWWSSQGFAALLFGVTPADVSVYLGVTALLMLVGFTAAWLPARRAAGVDPVVSLRR
ncbi:MAG TPA: ABC transporter permease [Vicinamibacterales bacterium]